MLSKLRPRSAYDVMAALSLFIVLGGTSYAVATGSIDSREIKNNDVRGKDIRNRTVTHRDVKRNGLGGTNIKESRLGKVPSASSADRAATAGMADNANTVGGQSAASLRLRCPAGTRRFAGACFELAPRRVLDWFEAGEICGRADGRLPSLSELFAFAGEPGIVLGTQSYHNEWTSNYYRRDTDGAVVEMVRDRGVPSPAGGAEYPHQQWHFRCVRPLVN